MYKDRESTFQELSIRDKSVSVHYKESVHYGSETIVHLGPKMWELVPQKIKDSESINILKSNIKLWKPKNCPCRLCKLYLPQIEFL